MMMDEKRAMLTAHSCLMGILPDHTGHAFLSNDNIAEIQRHIADALIAIRHEALKECLREVVDTQRGLTTGREYSSEIVGGAANRIRALIEKEA